MQIYKKVFYCLLIVVLTVQGCSKELAPQTIQSLPGKSERKINREQRKRERRAYWHKRKTNKITRKAEKKLDRQKASSIKAEKKLRERHIKKQDAKTQERMKASKKESEKNNAQRTLRQRLRLWKFKK